MSSIQPRSSQRTGTFYLLYHERPADNVIRVEFFLDDARSEEEERVYELRKSGTVVKEIYSGPCSFCGCWLVDENGRAICSTCRAPLYDDLVYETDRDLPNPPSTMSVRRSR